MTEGNLSIHARMAALRASFALRLSTDLEELTAVGRSVVAGGGQTEAWSALEDLHGLSHRLAGSGATFGFSDVSATAGAIEDLCRSLLGDEPALTLDEREKIGRLMERLAHEIGLVSGTVRHQ